MEGSTNPSRSRLAVWLVLGAAAILLFAFSLIALVVYFQPDSDESWDLALPSSNQVALIEISGTIIDPKPTVDLLRSYRKRSGVRAVLLHINSPGGGAAASQEIYSEILRFKKESKKVVVAAMGSVAASGGYYVACAADKIVANPATITGSIGVIAQWINWGDLLAWAKLKDQVIKSGPLKDAGNPSRPLTDAELKYFQGLIDGLYMQFVKAVAAGRQMDEQVVRQLADGRVYTGEEALQHGLIDQLGTLQDAIELTAKLAHISGEPRIVTQRKKKATLLDLLLGDAAAKLPFLDADPSQSHYRFEYIWR